MSLQNDASIDDEQKSGWLSSALVQSCDEGMQMVTMARCAKENGDTLCNWLQGLGVLTQKRKCEREQAGES